mgnify:CR=1 FL=1
MRSIRSKDGTNIAFEITGQGPALILITGALNYSKFGVVGDLVPLLSDKFTVINYDRRGRGQSQSYSPWSIAKEIEDIDALIDKLQALRSNIVELRANATATASEPCAPESICRYL